VLEAQGEVARFSKLLPEYKAAPEITRERLYIETMEKVLSHTRKVLVSDKGNNLMVLPLDQMLRGNNAAASDTKSDETGLLPSVPGLTGNNGKSSADSSSSRSSGSVMDQRRVNAQRDDTLRVGRE
jgi:membrane protease subunit HflK